MGPRATLTPHQEADPQEHEALQPRPAESILSLSHSARPSAPRPAVPASLWTSLSQEPLATRAPRQGTVMEGAPEKVSRKRAAPSPSSGDTCMGSRHPHPSAQTLSVFLHPSVPPPPPRLAASRLMPVLSLWPRPYPAIHTLVAALAGQGEETDRGCAHPPRKPDGELDDHPQPIHCLGVPPS